MAARAWWSEGKRQPGIPPSFLTRSGVSSVRVSDSSRLSEEKKMKSTVSELCWLQKGGNKIIIIIIIIIIIRK